MNNFDYNAAIQDGANPNDIQKYLQANPNLKVINAPQQASSQPSNQSIQKSQGNPLLDWLPTAGGILGGVAGAFVPVAGETGISEVGGAALGQSGGQYIKDLLTGQKPGWDVAGQGAIGGLTGGAGLIGGKILSSVLGKGAVDAALGPLNLSGKQIAQFGSEIGQPVTDFLAKFGLSGVDKEGLDVGLKTANKAYDDMANVGAPASQQAFIDNLNKVKSNILGSKDGIVPSGAQKTWDNLYGELKSNVFPKMGITEDATGNLVADASKTPTMADILKGKQAFAAQTTSAQFAADPEKFGVNRLAGNILRQTLNQSATDAEKAGLLPGGSKLAQTGVNLMHLNDLADMAGKRLGSSPSVFGTGNLLRKSVGALAGGAVGTLVGNPLAGSIAGVAGEQGIESALRNPVVANLLSSGLSKSAGIVSKLTNPAAIAATLGGGAIAGSLVSGNNNNQQQGSSQQQNPGQNIVDQSQNNQQQGVQDNHGQSVSQDASTVNNLGITQDKNGNKVFPSQLPELSTISNRIPGQTYTPEQQQADQAILEKNQAQAAASRDPFAQEQVNQQASDIQRKASQNDQIVNQYLKTHQLGDPQVQFVQNSANTYQQLQDLRGLVSSSAGKSLFTSVLNDNPVYSMVKAATDPKYQQMVQLMTQLGFSGARSAEGGRPSNFDVTSVLGISPAKGDTQTQALAKLDQLQTQFIRKYNDWAPLYGYTLNSLSGQSGQQTAPAAPQQSATQSTPTTPGGFVNYLNGLSGVPGR